MRSHAHDLRAEVAGFESTLEADRYVNAVARDWRTAPLDAVDRALCAYAEKMTLQPAEMGAADVGRLRDLGLSDRAIHDAVQVIAYFSYINRVAEGLGVEPEAFVRPWGELDLGADERRGR
jgi:uncharacterized peroxidase-related enzyme